MQIHSNLTAERPTFVSHLECSWTGEAYEADRPHNFSKAGKPLLVRKDLAGVRNTLTKEDLAERPQDLWRWRELLPVRRAGDIVSLGEAVTPIVPLPRSALHFGGGDILVKDEARLPTGSFKARGLAMAISIGEGIRIDTSRNAQQRQCRGAALSAFASRAGIRATVFCPEDTPEINLSEIALQGAAVYRVNGLLQDVACRPARPSRRARGPL